jgi:hypothetical protein
MSDILFDLGVSALITTLRGLKGAQKKAKMKAVFLKIHNLIKGVYGDDPDFN